MSKRKRYPLRQPLTQAKAIALLVDGKNYAEAASELGVTRQAMRAFALHHSEEIEALQSRVVVAAEDAAIRSKVERIRRLQVTVDRIERIIDERERRYGDSGLLRHDVKWVGSALAGREVDVARFDAPLVQQYRALLRDAAEELGQIPKAPTLADDPGLQPAIYEFHYHADDPDAPRDPFEGEYGQLDDRTSGNG